MTRGSACSKLEDRFDGIAYSLRNSITCDEIKQILGSPYFDQQEIASLPDPLPLLERAEAKFIVLASAGETPVAGGGIAVHNGKGRFGVYVGRPFRGRDVMKTIYSMSLRAAQEHFARLDADALTHPDELSRLINYVPPIYLQELEFVVPRNLEALAAARHIGFDTEHPYFAESKRNAVVLVRSFNPPLVSSRTPQ